MQDKNYDNLIFSLADIHLVPLIEDNDRFKNNNNIEYYLEVIEKECYLPELYYFIGRLLQNDDEIIEIKKKKYNRKELYRISIQLGNRNSSVFYHLAMLIGSNSNSKVKLPILDEDSYNHYYGYFDLICQAIYHSPITFNESTHRYYISLILYLKNKYQ